MNREKSNKISFDTIDVSKGVLIILIVLFHNTVISKQYIELRNFFYNWHVYAFLLIPALLPFRPGREYFIRDRAVRYGVPFFWWFSAVWAVSLFLSGNYREPGASIVSYFAALFFGSAELLDQAGGARLFWFLPALFGLVVLRWFGATVLARHSRNLAGALAACGFLFAGLIPKPVADYIPWGLPIALYCVGPMLVFGLILPKVMQFSGAPLYRFTVGLALSIVCALCYAISLRYQSQLVLASFDFFDVMHPVPLIVHCVLALSACGAVIVFSSFLENARWLHWLGRNSLVIYLSHQIIFLMSLRAARTVGLISQDNSLGSGALLFVVTMVVSTAICVVINRSPLLTALLLPRDLEDLRQALRRPFLASSLSKI